MTDLEVRQGVLDTIGESIEQLGEALSALGLAYELLDEHSQDRLEDQLFGPVQKGYGRAKKTYADFATRYGLPAATFAQPSSTSGSRDVRRFLDAAIEAVDEAEEVLIHLQDSGQTVDYGDAELRAGLAGVREIIGGVREGGRSFMRTLGR
jgi:hypothetical protein